MLYGYPCRLPHKIPNSLNFQSVFLRILEVLNFISLNFGRDSGRCRSRGTVLFCARCNFSFVLDVLGVFELLCLLTQCWWRPRDLLGCLGCFFEVLRMAILAQKSPALWGRAVIIFTLYLMLWLRHCYLLRYCVVFPVSIT